MSSSPCPHELNALWLANVDGDDAICCLPVRTTRSLELLGDRKYLGAKPGHHRHAAHLDARRCCCIRTFIVWSPAGG